MDPPQSKDKESPLPKASNFSLTFYATLVVLLWAISNGWKTSSMSFPVVCKENGNRKPNVTYWKFSLKLQASKLMRVWFWRVQKKRTLCLVVLNKCWPRLLWRWLRPQSIERWTSEQLPISTVLWKSISTTRWLAFRDVMNDLWQVHLNW